MSAGETPDGAGESHAPFILTLAFDEAGFARFEAMRQRHFPAHRNQIPAHLTLFHKLPGTQEAEIARVVRDTTRERPPFPIEATGLRFLGYGSAYAIASPELAELRGDLARSFALCLGPQDRQGFRPHVTIQNKAAAGDAKALFAELQTAFEPFGCTATGLLLWRYQGGPWERAGYFPFAGSPARM